MSIYEDAKAKLEREAKEGKFGRHEAAMKSAVVKALKDFAKQDEGFARRIAEGRSFEECMKAVANGVSGSISDLEAYRRAVKYFEPEAEVEFQMVLRRSGSVEKPPETGKKEAVVFDLMDFL